MKEGERRAVFLSLVHLKKYFRFSCDYSYFHSSRWDCCNPEIVCLRRKKSLEKVHLVVQQPNRKSIEIRVMAGHTHTQTYTEAE